MASVSLTTAHHRHKFFQETVHNNLGYWQTWLEAHQDDVVLLDQKRDNILRAITYAFDLDTAWPLVFKLVTTLSPFMERRGHWESWQWALRQALAAAQRVTDQHAEVTLSVLLARLLFQQSDFKAAIHHYRHTIRQARSIKDRFNEARACTNLGYHFVEQGYWHRAEILCCHALQLFEALDSNHGRAHTENHLGILYTRQHRWEEAQHHLQRACEVWQIMEDQHGLMRGLINLGGLYIKMEQAREALSHLEKALSLAELIGAEAPSGIIYMNMGHASLIDKNITKAETYSFRAEKIFHQFSNTTQLARVWGNLGRIYAYQSQWDKSAMYLEKSLAKWRTLNNRIDEINTLMDMIEYEVARGKRRQARIRLQEVEQLLGLDSENTQYRHLYPHLEKYRQDLKE